MDRNEAIEIVREYYPSSGKDLNEALEALIPELKENKDEMIRKALIELVKKHCVNETRCMMEEWLEKKGKEEYALKSFNDEDVHKFVQYIKRQAKAYELNLPNRSYDIYGFAKDILSWFEKQGEKINIQTINDVWKDMRLEVGAQASGNRHEPQYSDNSTKLFSLNDIDEIIEKISEKQGEQKPDSFKAEHGKYYYCIKDYFSGGKKQASKGDVVQALRGLPIMGLDDASEFFLPVNDMQLNNGIDHNVSPKFKVGDWVVFLSSETLRIVKIDFTSNYYWFNDGSFLSIVDEDCLHSWTLRDAKDGDILVMTNDDAPFIFKGFLDKFHPDSPVAYGGIVPEGNFYISSGDGWWDAGEISPATKEQCDLLFQKMKEAGYEWDTEKKELRKAEPRFKVGDWVVTEDGKVSQVKTVSDDGDAYTLDDETYFSGSWKDMYHLWTIQDAKDGDVLANKYGSVFIYAGFEDDEKVTVDDYCYITVNHHEFCIEDHKTGSWYYIRDLNPATQEQRGLLFQKMEEAGYEWDAEKKELRKIEQKPVPITDEWIEDYWKHNKVNNPYSYDKGDEIQFDHDGFIRFCNKYFKKSAWSEEDEMMLASFLHKLEVCTLLTNKEYQWADNKLKSLTSRN